MEAFLPYVVIAAVTGAGLVTGLLFAFSNFVLDALADLPSEQGMFAMQRVNERILNPIFFFLFFGTPLSCVFIVLGIFFALGVTGHALLLAGAIAYLMGPFGITVLFNVPLNNKLAAASSTTDSESAWPEYQARWQRWNHIRTYIGVISIVLLSIGLAAL